MFSAPFIGFFIGTFIVIDLGIDGGEKGDY